MLASPTAHKVDVPDDVIVVGENEVKRGRTARFHEVVHGRRFAISATSFWQARPDGAAALVDAVRDAFVDDGERGTFVDAYCGVGLFAGLLGTGRKIIGVERHGPAVRDARDNLGADAQVVRAEVAAWNPVPARVVVADPSRPGLGGKAAARLAATGGDQADPRQLRPRRRSAATWASSPAWASPIEARPWSISSPTHPTSRWSRGSIVSSDPSRSRHPNYESDSYGRRERRAAARPERCRARCRGRAVPTGRPRRGVPAPRRSGLRPRPAGCSPTSRSRRKSRRRCSFACGTTLIGSSRAAARFGPTSSHRRMVEPSTCCARRGRGVAARSGRPARDR